MIPQSQISETNKEYICSKLKQLENKHSVQIILAVESGSRAWGFPSQDSDYDVRFLYVRSKEDYLSINSYDDTIDEGCIADSYLGTPLDLNGWDLKKALRLGIKSNPVLLEWIQSPINYFINNDIIVDFKDLLFESAKLNQLEYHYDRLARNSWQHIEKDDNFSKCKLYLYALRPTLALDFLRKYQIIPPMDIAHLCKKLVKEENFEQEIVRIISVKATSNEHDTMSRIELIDSYISSVLANYASKPIIGAGENLFLNKANNYFKKLLKTDVR